MSAAHHEFKHATRIPLVKYTYPDSTVTVQLKDEPFERELTIPEYNKRFVVNMTHGIYYKPEIEPLVKLLVEELRSPTTDLTRKICTESTSAGKAVNDFLHNPKNYFKIRYINDKCGHAIVAKEDIPAGTIVGVYSGELLIEEVGKPFGPKERADSVYDASVIKRVMLGVGKNRKTYSVSIRAKDFGDNTRFAPDLPGEDEVKESMSVARDINKKDIFLQNITFPLAIHDGKPIIFYCTTRPIKKSQFAGISYGKDYWSNRGKPDRFLEEKEGFRVIAYDGGVYKDTKEFIPYQTPVPVSSHSVAASVVRPMLPPKPPVLVASPAQPVSQSRSVPPPIPARPIVSGVRLPPAVPSGLAPESVQTRQVQPSHRVMPKPAKVVKRHVNPEPTPTLDYVKRARFFRVPPVTGILSYHRLGSCAENTNAEFMKLLRSS